MDIKGVHVAKTQLGQQKMDTVVLAAEKLWSEKDFHQTSISEICKKAKIAIGTFYIYFDDKKALYTYLVFKYKAEIISAIQKATLGCSTRAQKEKEGIKAFVKYAYKNPLCFNILWGSLSVDKNLFSNYYTSFANSYSRSLNKDKDQLSVEDTKTLSYFLMGVTNFIALQAILEQNIDEKDIDNLIDTKLMPIMFNGLLK